MALSHWGRLTFVSSGLSGHQKSRILSGALMELHLDFFNEFGDEDYFRVPRILLNLGSESP